MAVLPVITIRQPWAFLIFNEHEKIRKDVENRNWKLPEKYINTPVLIHSSAKPIFRASDAFMQHKRRGFNFKDAAFHTVKSCTKNGHIVGVVRFAECVRFDNTNFFSAWCDGTASFWWRIGKAKALTPVPAKGKLSFWKFDYPHEAELEGF